MNKIKELYKRITRDRWEIGFVQGGLTAVMTEESLQINWLKHHYRDRWFADPFVLDVTDDEIQLLVEEYSYDNPKGRIALLVVDKGSFELKSFQIVLELDTHVSFPAIWRGAGRVFVYPESWQSGRLCLFELKNQCCNPASGMLICKEAMADAIMTKRFGKMQLFSVKQNDKMRIYDLNETTGLFSLSFEKPFGRATARNAGDFFDYQGKTYRPAQVCDHQYGEAVEIQQVIWDEHDNFCFIPHKTLYSNHPKLNTGLHTLNSYKGVTVIDVHGWEKPLAVNSIIAMKKLFTCCDLIRNHY